MRTSTSSVLQCSVLQCSVLQRVAVYCSVLQYDVVIPIELHAHIHFCIPMRMCNMTHLHLRRESFM